MCGESCLATMSYRRACVLTDKLRLLYARAASVQLIIQSIHYIDKCLIPSRWHKKRYNVLYFNYIKTPVVVTCNLLILISPINSRDSRVITSPANAAKGNILVVSVSYLLCYSNIDESKYYRPVF